MEQENSQIPWTEEQWGLVQQTVREEAAKVRIAASFLPLYGPLPSDAESVSLQKVDVQETGETRLRGEAEARLVVDDQNTRSLTTISVNIFLRRSQVAQPDLSSALLMFRRAANLVARIEDRLVFGGQPSRNPTTGHFSENLKVEPPIYRVTGGDQFPGLCMQDTVENNRIVIADEKSGEELVHCVAEAIISLEGKGHLFPFALILGSRLFVTAHTPNSNSLVLPADRITPMLNGPLLRSSILPATQAVLISLAGDPVDLVVASEISVKFLQVTMEPRYIFRVSERFTLRVKQPQAIMVLTHTGSKKKT